MTGKKVEEESRMEYIPLWERESREEGIKIAIKQGVEEGGKKKAMEMAKKSLEEDLSIEIISKLTALSK